MERQRLSHDVMVRQPPELGVYPEEETITVVEGTKLNLDCHLNPAEGHAYWVLNNKSTQTVITSSLLPSSYLSFPSVSRAEAGDYTCLGSNGFRNNTPVTVTRRVQVDCKSE